MGISRAMMVRFMMTLEDAVNLVFYVLKNGRFSGCIEQNGQVTTLGILTQVLIEVINVPDYKMKIIGTRHGEKLFEPLLSLKEIESAENLRYYFLDLEISEI